MPDTTTIKIAHDPRPGLPHYVEVTRGTTVSSYTMSAIAEASELDLSAVTRIFKLEREGRHDTIERIAAALEVDPMVIRAWQHQTRRGRRG